MHFEFAPLDVLTFRVVPTAKFSVDGMVKTKFDPVPIPVICGIKDSLFDFTNSYLYPFCALLMVTVLLAGAKHKLISDTAKVTSGLGSTRTSTSDV